MSETSGDQPGQTPGEQPGNPYGQPYGQPTPPGGWPPPPPPPPSYQQPGQQSPYSGYQQPAYGQPAYGQPATPYGAGYAVPNEKNATTALVLGIVGLVGGFVCGLGFIVSPFALFMGQASKRRIDASGGQLGGRGNAQAGFILGIIGTVLLVLLILAVIAFIVLLAIGVSQTHSGFSTGTNA